MVSIVLIVLLSILFAIPANAAPGGNVPKYFPPERVATPESDIISGIYSTTISVNLATATEGAIIYYTTDDSNPKNNLAAQEYSGPIVVDHSLTIRAYAIKDGMLNSKFTVLNYVIESNIQQVAMPSASPIPGTYTDAQSVTLSTVTEGAAIFYTLDGSDPLTSSTVSVFDGTPISVAASTMIEAYATKDGMMPSDVATFDYVIEPLEQVVNPAASPDPGTYYGAQSVTLSTATDGASIYYTLDGSDPMSSETRIAYSSPINVESTTMIKAYAVKDGMADSNEAAFDYVIKSLEQVAVPVASPEPGLYNSIQNVTLASSTEGATIYYTVDGSNPTTSETKAMYSSAILVSATTTIKAYAVKENMMDSSVAAFNYTISNEATIKPNLIAAGSRHTLYIANGEVWFRGSDGVYDTYDDGIAIKIPGLTNVASVSAGNNYSLALKNDGTVWQWGTYSTVTAARIPTQVPGLTDVVAISAGTYHAVALKGDGTVWTWGSNVSGALGIGEYGTPSDHTPRQVVDPNDATDHLTGIKKISAGASHTLAVKDDGTLYSWGLNDNGQLGIGTNESGGIPTPQKVKNSSGDGYIANIVEIAAGPYHSVAVLEGTFNGVLQRKVYTWGYNGYGQLGYVTDSYYANPLPQEVLGLGNIVAVSAGDDWGGVTLALDSEGLLSWWGCETDYLFGDEVSGAYNIKDRYAPANFPYLANISAIEAGGEYGTFVAIDRDGNIYGWGCNQFAQLGSRYVIIDNNQLPREEIYIPQKLN